MRMQKQSVFDLPVESFLPKILGLFLIRILTGCLGPSEFSLVIRLQYFVCILGLAATLGVSEAIRTYSGGERAVKAKAYMTSLVFSLVTLIIVLCIFPLISSVLKFKAYVSYMIIMLFVIRFRTINRQYAQANNYTRLCNTDNIINILLFAAFTVIFVSVCELGVKGYFLSVILSDAVSCVFIMAVTNMKNDLKSVNIDMKLARNMAAVSAAYVCVALCWWMMRYVNFYMVSSLVSAKESGMYICAYMISDSIIITQIMLHRTWTDDMFEYKDKNILKSHYTKAFDSYISLMTASAAVVLLLIKVIMSILTDKAYWDAYRFVPFIIMALVIQSICAFLSRIYFRKGLERTFLKCASLAVIMNIIFDIILIPFLDAQGASIAALISSFILYIMVIVDTQRIMKYAISWRKIGLNIITLLYMSVIIVLKVPVMYVWLLIGVILIGLINYPALTATVNLYMQNKK